MKALMCLWTLFFVGEVVFVIGEETIIDLFPALADSMKENKPFLTEGKQGDKEVLEIFAIKMDMNRVSLKVSACEFLLFCFKTEVLFNELPAFVLKLPDSHIDIDADHEVDDNFEFLTTFWTRLYAGDVFGKHFETASRKSVRWNGWHKFCHGINASSGEIVHEIDGQVVSHGKIIPELINNSNYLEQLLENGSIVVYATSLADLRVTHKRYNLSAGGYEEEIIYLWDDEDFYSEVFSKNVTRKVVEDVDLLFDMVSLPPMSYVDAFKACLALGNGQLLSYNNRMMDRMKSANVPHMWMAEKKVFNTSSSGPPMQAINMYTKERVDIDFWYAGSLESKAYDCIGCSSLIGCYSFHCLFDHKSICVFESFPAIHLRGNIKVSSRIFTPKSVDNNLFWVGSDFDLITFDEGLWVLWNMVTMSMTALLQADVSTLALGIKTWKKVENEVISTSELSLSSCTHQEFTCREGSCIDLDKRCNGINDCLDESDEHDCTLLMVHPEYDQETDPSVSYSDIGHMVLKSKVTIERFFSYSEHDGKVRVMLNIHLVWKDPRLEFVNLKEGSHENRLSKGEMSQIWTPEMFYSNRELADFEVLDGPMVSIVKNTTAVPQAMESSHALNQNHYSGHEHSLDYTITISGNFFCEFNTIWYPFDQQTCQIFYTLARHQLENIRLLPDTIAYLQEDPWSVAEYRIERVCHHPHVDYVRQNLSLLAVTFVLRRNENAFLLTTVLPIAVTIIIVHVTNFFGREHFDAAIAVNVTLLLVITTMYVSMSNNLPKTEYLKLGELWMIFLLCQPLIEILLQTYIKYLETSKIAGPKDRKNTKRTMTKSNSSILPVNITISSVPDRNKTLIRVIRFFLLKIKPVYLILANLGFVLAGIYSPHPRVYDGPNAICIEN